jgi:hypothetical protein
MINFNATPDYGSSKGPSGKDRWKGTCSLEDGTVLIETDYLFESAYDARQVIRTEFVNRFRNALGVSPQAKYGTLIHAPGTSRDKPDVPSKATEPAGKGEVPPNPYEAAT